MGLLRNGTEEAALPLRLRGARNVRAEWTRGVDVFGGHRFTTAWTEQIPQASAAPFVLPMKTAVVPPSGDIGGVYSRPIGRGIAHGIGF